MGFLSGIVGGDAPETKTAPWKQAAPYGKEIMGEAQDIYKAGPIGGYGGEMVAGLNPWQNIGYQWMADRATQGNPLVDQAQGGLSEMMAGGYNPAMAGYGQIFNQAGQGNPAMDMMAFNAMQQNPAMAGLSGFAQTGQGNPYLNQMYEQGTRNILDQYNQQTTPNISAMMSRAGRVGSQAHQNLQDQAQENLMTGLTDYATGLFGGQYQSDMNRALQAQMGLGQFGAGDLQRQLSAASGIGGLYNQGIGQQLAALQGLGGQYQQDLARQMQAIGMAPGMAQQDYGDIDRLLQAGGGLQDQRQRELMAEYNRWNQGMFGQGSPWGSLQQYNQALGPWIGMGGQTSGGGGGFLDPFLGAGAMALGAGWKPFGP